MKIFKAPEIVIDTMRSNAHAPDLIGSVPTYASATARIGRMGIDVVEVLCARCRSKILQPVIGSIAVLVINILVIAQAKKCLSYKSVNIIAGHLARAISDRHRHIAALHLPAAKDFLLDRIMEVAASNFPLKRLNSAHVANLIQSFVSKDWQPSFVSVHGVDHAKSL